MAFNIKKDNGMKTIPTDSLNNVEDDTILFTKSGKIFDNKPEDLNEEQGMDFLIPEVEKEESVYEDYNSNQDDDPFMENNFTEKDTRPEMSYEDIQQEKSFCLSRLKRFQARGFIPSRRFSMEHSLDELKGEVFRIQKEIDMDSGIDYCRQGLMFCVSTIEMVNGQYKLPGKLDGWSQSVMSNIDSYDQVFEELYEAYYSKLKMAPEIKLISMIAGSAFMFHLQKSLLNNESLSRKQRDMSGPELNTDEMLQALNDEVGDISDISSEISMAESIESIKIEPQTKKIPIKKRGRPRKNA